MLYADGDIKKLIKRGELEIEPYDEKQLLPEAYSLRLDSKFRFVRIGDITCIDVKKKQELTEMMDLKGVGHVNLRPGELVLGSSAEKVKLGKRVAGLIFGRTSLSRLGLQLDTSASLVSPGFEGKLTLVLHNVFALPIRLYVGMRIAELAFLPMSSAVSGPYGEGKFSRRYQGQKEPRESMIWEDWE